MKISYNWLKQYIDINYSVEELKEKLTFAGIEVEEVIKIGEELKQVKVAEIIDKEKHPNAENLSICTINDGKEKIQVICGASNCGVGKKVAFAPIGTIFGDFKIKKAKLRGVLSFGMLCSEKELGISENHDGIMILNDEAEIGNDLASYLKKSDTVYDVEITPNRPDLLGMIGIARDLSALVSKPVDLPVVKLNESDEQLDNAIKLKNESPKLCTRYTARIIKNVTIKESPEWLKNRLFSMGLRPINNIVDITNFVMMEYGHPLHAFDYDLIENQTVIIRNAKKGEKLFALDANQYDLLPSDLVIADDKKPVALAGIIGGKNSHITDETKNIVLEAANFKYNTIRKTADRLNITTDSAYRFERNLSDETTDIVSERAADLILQLAGGELLKGKLDSYPDPITMNKVNLRIDRVNRILGLDIKKKKIIDYLSALGLEKVNEDNNLLTFKVPANRKDLTREIDLIEEIIRLNGYNNVPSYLKNQNIMNKDRIFSRRKVKNILVEHGFSEIRNWNFGDPEDFENLNLPEDDPRRRAIYLKNPLGARFSIMRSFLLPSLLKNALYNVNHGTKNIKTFELAKNFLKSSDKLAIEEYHICGVMTGNLNPVHWKNESIGIDFFDVKGIIEEILDGLCVKDVTFIESNEPFYQNGVATDIIFKENYIGSIGKIDMIIAERYGIKNEIFAFDLNLDKINKMQKIEYAEFREIPKFPPVLRDLSFIINKEYSIEQIEKVIKNVNGNIIKDIILFDVFEGKTIEEGCHSLSYNLIFSSDKKTLTDDYINKIIIKIQKDLELNFDIKMR